MERKMDTFSKTQETLIQAMHRIEKNQVSPQDDPISERSKETLPINHCQMIETLGKSIRLKI